MVRKTEALILKTLPYQDAHLIVNCLTEAEGRLSFMVKGARSARNHGKAAALQPLHVLDFLYTSKPGRDLQTLTDFSIVRVPHLLTTDPIRNCYGLLLTEVVLSSVREEEQNEDLYREVTGALVALDEAKQGLYPIIIHALLSLTGYLGFQPTAIDHIADADLDFDPVQGLFFERAHPAHAYAHWLRTFLLVDAANANEVVVPKGDRKGLLNAVLHYYSIHVEGFRYPKTLAVFEDLYR